MTHEKLRQGERWPWLFGGIRPVTRAGAVRDALAGITLAAMNVPQALGYTRIAGTPVVTGLYTLLLPLVAFAALGSSRYLVVAADSATAAILAGGLSQMAPIASAHYVALAGIGRAADRRMSAAGAVVQARLPRRFPFADGAGRLSYRRRLPGRHRDARRDAGRAGQLQPDGRAARAGRPRFAAGACADAVPRGGGVGDRSRPQPACAAACPGRSSRSLGRLQRAPRSTSPGTASPSSKGSPEVCRRSAFRT